MTPRIPEKNKKPGVCYAFTDDGIELPVVDITNPAFALEVNEDELPAFAEEWLRSMEKWLKLPAFVRSFVGRRSVLMGASTRGSVLSGMATYLYKLGPDNLSAAYAGPMDKKVAGNVTAVAVRMRFRDVARLLADGLGPALAAQRGCPVHFLNLGGGAGADSLNALILMRKENPGSLAGREVRIHVLDKDRVGPSFGARALNALVMDGAPLAGLQATFEHFDYDWSDPSALRGLVGESGCGGRADEGVGESVVIGSSEGGLFEYGSDQEIAGNLAVLHSETPEDFVMVGTAFRDERVSWVMKKMGGMSFQPRTMESLEELVGRAGWEVARAVEGNPVYHVFNLGKIAP